MTTIRTALPATPPAMPAFEKALVDLTEAIENVHANPPHAEARAAVVALYRDAAGDTSRMEWLGTALAGTKWADELTFLRPRDESGEYTEKYITGPTALRAAIDAFMESRP